MGGFVDLTLNQAPDFGRLDRNVYYLQGFSDHGLALAVMAGRLVAETIAGHTVRFDLLARIKHHRLPGGALLRTTALAQLRSRSVPTTRCVKKCWPSDTTIKPAPLPS